MINNCKTYDAQFFIVRFIGVERMMIASKSRENLETASTFIMIKVTNPDSLTDRRSQEAGILTEKTTADDLVSTSGN